MIPYLILPRKHNYALRNTNKYIRCEDRNDKRFHHKIENLHDQGRKYLNNKLLENLKVSMIVLFQPVDKSCIYHDLHNRPNNITFCILYNDFSLVNLSSSSSKFSINQRVGNSQSRSKSCPFIWIAIDLGR